MSLFDTITTKLFPLNTRRRLFGVMILSVIREPRRFLALLTPTNIGNLFYYLREVGPYVIEQSLKRTLADEDGKSVRFNNRLGQLVSRNPSGEPESKRDNRLAVDLIIPVFNGLDLVRTCIASVLANSTDCRVVIVDDCSTDPALAEYLSGLHDLPEKGITVGLLRNAENLGFVRSVNRALAKAPGHAVILNSDTEVPPGWLDRLLAPILADERVATTTPLTNAATICSFPEINRDNPPYKGVSATEIDRFFRRYAPVEPVEAPTGVGFCMAVSRQALSRVGLLDAETFGRGYGEESDFCRKAVKSGMRNVIVPNLYVFHNHGGSFASEEKNRLLEVNREKLLARHPEYLAAVDEFCKSDPLAEVRELLAAVIDAGTTTSGKVVAIVDHALGGGANMYSTILAGRLRATGASVLHLKASPLDGTCQVVFSGETVNREFRLPLTSDIDAGRLLSLFAVECVAVNELVGWPDPLGLMAAITASGLPYLVFCHDYFLVCPKWFLVDHQGTFCGIPDDHDLCRECLVGDAPSAFRALYGGGGFDRNDWCRRAGEFLASAQQIVCFSNSSALLLRRAYPAIPHLQVVEHAIPDRERFVWQRREFAGGTLNVAVIGTIDQFKGIGIIRELVESAGFARLPVTVTVVGETTLYPPNHQSTDGKFKVVGPYRREELPALLERYRTHVVLMPSICPETFSYVTSEVLLLGYPIICFDLGAQAERVKRFDCGIVVHDRSASGIINALTAILQHPEQIAELSERTRQYLPVTQEQHFALVIPLILANSCGKRA